MLNAEYALKNHIVYSLVILLSSLIAAAIMLRFVVTPLKKMESAVTSLSKGKGDLTQRLVVSGGKELSVLSNAVNSFVARIDNMVSQVTYSVVRLAPMAKELADTNANILQAANEKNNQTRIINKNMDEALAITKQVQQKVTNISEITATCVQKLEGGQKLSSGTIDSMTSLEKSIMQTHQAVKQL